MDRLILVSSQKTIEDYFNENVHDHNLIYNGFPSCRYPISLANGDLEIMQWGYYYPKLKTCFTNIPVSNKIIFDKRFQISIRTQRCIIPCNCVSLVFNGRRFLIR